MAESRRVRRAAAARRGGVLGSVSAGWSALAAGCWLFGRNGTASAGPDDITVPSVSAGRVCRSALPRGLELSCGAHGFGDLRYRCPAAHSDGARCARTAQVTVRNSGRPRVYVSWTAGPRQGCG
ncbi:hypothetical protein, partial [Streptomyces sp. NPDC002172]